ncbi:MAG: tRNA pseudouridine(38-40) synthase TruA [Ruminococcus sp.]|jgi:tRNA pseudouridine38-40 synthase
MNCRITIQYDGSRYNGWQKQGNTKNTIQGKLEDILTRMTGEPVEVHGAGRTDAGVHAIGQTANFHLKGKWNPEEVREYLNRYLPEDIEVTALGEVSPRFHSRLSAVEKVYAYRIGLDGRKSVFRRKYRYCCPGKLNVEAMKEGAGWCVGTHDFRSFCANRHMKKSTVRTITDITFSEKEGDLIITYTGNGFLYHMVRILTGTLLEIGEGKRKPEEMKEILEGKDRTLAGRTAPAQGLMLMEVRYGDEYEV